MKVILKQDVAKVGKKGDLVEVSDGYGRNFLVGRGLGEEATPGKLREYQEFQKTQKARDDKRQKSAEEMKKKLGGKLVSVKVSAGEGGKLFGSVTSAQVAEALSAQFGAGIDKKDIKLDESIKQAGSYAFRIKLYPGVEAEMTLKVESE
ncbi:50S ribosomal protein L9 [Cloacibacillus evryensis]|jgi:large subunit ribosomal protein L9|uniref:Large ribosomal subunit protein bL9 n=1 Tax=Cloacibacillus evryensis TaxID=508460 RepID=A0AAW5JZQ7_9BACT|nr:50S ribosomal protein L9 [Cloacibacillus evryensis]EHL63827.1 ribosomal protein L9 [Synergistes sp. 3_1_syn1]MCQ4814050.1 50S ribosomal protein L9 [Cloacibacillus evryensis]